MYVSAEHHAFAALSQTKNAVTHWIVDRVSCRALLGVLETRKNILALSGFEPRIVKPIIWSIYRLLNHQNIILQTVIQKVSNSMFSLNFTFFDIYIYIYIYIYTHTQYTHNIYIYIIYVYILYIYRVYICIYAIYTIFTIHNICTIYINTIYAQYIYNMYIYIYCIYIIYICIYIIYTIFPIDNICTIYIYIYIHYALQYIQLLIPYSLSRYFI